MPGHLYVTQGQPEHLLQITGDLAPAMKYRVEQSGAWTLKLQQGSLAASIFVGAFVAYCDFTVNIIVPGDGTTHWVLERNTPWWTGIIGVNRVKGRARDLADAYGNEMARQGVPILQRNDF
ncbi:MAG: hypothetical protein H6839_00795 [Planctomycetes bacterium]|nr:hypothetical protein [Planctomycetota bacterium]